MIEIDGSRYSGSGTIVRQAVAFAALTGQAVHLVKARVRCLKPGLRPQHIHVIEAIPQVGEDRPKGSSRAPRPSSFGLGRCRVKGTTSGTLGLPDRRRCWPWRSCPSWLFGAPRALSSYAVASFRTLRLLSTISTRRVWDTEKRRLLPGYRLARRCVM